MSFTLSIELLEQYAGVIPNIICCLYKVAPCTAYRILSKEIYTLTKPICYQIYKSINITNREYKKRIADDNRSFYAITVQQRGKNKTTTHTLKSRKSFYNNEFDTLNTYLILSFQLSGYWKLSHISGGTVKRLSHNISIMDVASDHIALSERVNMVSVNPKYAVDGLCNRIKKLNRGKHLVSLYNSLYYLMYNCLLFNILPKQYTLPDALYFTLQDEIKDDTEKYTFKEFITYLKPIDQKAYDLQKLQVIAEIEILQPILLHYVRKHFD